MAKLLKTELPLDDSDQPVKPLFTFGPGMRAMLLVALVFSCVGIYEMISKAQQLSWLSPSPENGDTPQTAWIAAIIRSIFIFGVPALIYANVFPQDRFGYFRLNVPVSGMKILIGAFLMIFLLPAINQGVTWVNNAITNQELRTFEDEMAKLDAWFIQMPTFGGFLFCLLANALVPAICEELLFRAGIQQILMERTRFKHVSIIATAMIFAFFHLDPISVPFIFLAGLILGYAFYWTGSLRITIVMHFLFNGISIFIEYMNQHSEAFKNYNVGMGIFVISIIGSAGFMFLLWKSSQKEIL